MRGGRWRRFAPAWSSPTIKDTLRMIKASAFLALWTASNLISAGTSLAATPLEPSDSAAPATPLVSSAAPTGALRPSPASQHPIDSVATAPDPVRFGGFHEKAKAPSQSFLSEGTFVYQRPALFSVDAQGKAIIEFDPDPKQGKNAKPSPPVYLLANLKRMAIEDALKGRSLPLIVSGTATEFDSHNYLLLDDDTHPAGPPAPAAAPMPRPTTAAKNLSADEMLGQLLRSAPGSAAARPAPPPPLRWDQPPESDRTSSTGSVSPGAPGVTLVREGRYLPDRLGRLTRGPDGKTAEFTFDSDGKSLRDPPLIIMPCAKLAQMQATQLAVGQDVHFRMSGTVSEYRGRNYILPEKIVSVAAAVLSF
jgi:hypothetical protein